MNTANLQLEGLYTTVSALMHALRQKGLLSEQDIDDALADVEMATLNDRGHRPELSSAQVDAIAFSIRYLRLANRRSADGKLATFPELAAQIGREKPHRADLPGQERDDIETSKDAGGQQREGLGRLPQR